MRCVKYWQDMQMCPLPKPFGHLNLLCCKAVLVGLLNTNVCNREALKSQWLDTLKVYFSLVSQLHVGSTAISYLIPLLVRDLHQERMSPQQGTAAGGEKGWMRHAGFNGHFYSQSIDQKWSHGPN